MRAIWSGSIAFGLVNIPIKLYSATNDKNIDFDYLHKKDLSPIRYAKICQNENKEINYSEIVRGYEYREGDYVVVTDEDLKRASPEQTKTVKILSFTYTSEINSEYFEKPYFLEPQKGAENAYFLLLKALKQSGKSAIAKFLLRSRESLAVLKPDSDFILLNKIRFYNQIRKTDELKKTENINIESGELEMAKSLIDKLTKKFKPEEYVDTYREKVEEIIDKRIKGKPLPPVKKAPDKKVQNLMSLLQESLKNPNQAL